jgi:hypothetical protein
MIGSIQIIKHETVPRCPSYEVRFPDGRPSRYFYWEDIPDRRAERAGPHLRHAPERPAWRYRDRLSMRILFDHLISAGEECRRH